MIYVLVHSEFTVCMAMLSLLFSPPLFSFLFFFSRHSVCFESTLHLTTYNHLPLFTTIINQHHLMRCCIITIIRYTTNITIIIDLCVNYSTYFLILLLLLPSYSPLPCIMPPLHCHLQYYITCKNAVKDYFLSSLLFSI
jgi:hypothetical protein